MGQKVNPHGFRVGVIKDWDSRWYAESDFADYLVEDYNIRTFLLNSLFGSVSFRSDHCLDSGNISANLFDSSCIV